MRSIARELGLEIREPLAKVLLVECVGLLVRSYKNGDDFCSDVSDYFGQKLSGREDCAYLLEDGGIHIAQLSDVFDLEEG